MATCLSAWVAQNKFKWPDLIFQAGERKWSQTVEGPGREVSERWVRPLCLGRQKRGQDWSRFNHRAAGSRAGDNFSFHGQTLLCSLQYILSHGDQFICFIGWGFPQSLHEVILQSKWNLGIAVLITGDHCQDSQTLFSFSYSHMSPVELTDLSALFQHNLRPFGDCSGALFHQPHLPVPPRSCWADEQAREEGTGMWDKDPGERWNDEDTEQNEGQAAEGILGAAPDPGPDERPGGST